MKESEKSDTKIEGPGIDPFALLEVAAPALVGGLIGSFLGAIALALAWAARSVSIAWISTSLLGLHLLHGLAVFLFVGRALASSRRRKRTASTIAHLFTLTIFLALWVWSRWGIG